jgi:hypothetical protein
MKATRRKKAMPPTRSRIRDAMTASAMAQVFERWELSEQPGATTDGSASDPERGPEDERVVAGERVRTYLDKAFGGRAVVLTRPDGDHELEYLLGRVADNETPASMIADELPVALGLPTLPTASAVAPGVWRNDRNGWVNEPIMALTEDEAIEQLVRAFQRLPESRRR